jgi:hypothetical protein
MLLVEQEFLSSDFLWTFNLTIHIDFQNLLSSLKEKFFRKIFYRFFTLYNPLLSAFYAKQIAGFTQASK